MSQDFFRNPLDMGTVWTPASDCCYQSHDRKTGKAKWTDIRVDFAFASTHPLRALIEAYAQCDAGEKIVQDFAAAWNKAVG